MRVWQACELPSAMPVLSPATCGLNETFLFILPSTALPDWQDEQDIPDLSVQHLSHLPREGAVYLGSHYSNMRQSGKVTDIQSEAPSKLNTWAAKPPSDWQVPDTIPPALSPFWKVPVPMAGWLPIRGYLSFSEHYPCCCKSFLSCSSISAMPDCLHLSPSSWLRNPLRCRELDARISSHNFPEHQQLEAR